MRMTQIENDSVNSILQRCRNDNNWTIDFT